MLNNVPENYLEKTFQLSSKFMVRELAGEQIIVPIESDQALDLSTVYLLNDVAARIVVLMDGHNSFADITRHLLDEFEVEADVLAQDIHQFLQKLCEMQALTMQ